uniref:Transcriptional regulator n=1 Tax=Ammonifex degensii TaxID=42838 RepID=A0A7C1FFE5_9THEO
MQPEPTSREETERELLLRLKKIEGQVRGIARMIQEGRSCGEIILQLSAVKAAVSQVAVSTLACYLTEAVTEGATQGKDLKASVAEFIELFRKLT